MLRRAPVWPVSVRRLRPLPTSQIRAVLAGGGDDEAPVGAEGGDVAAGAVERGAAVPTSHIRADRRPRGDDALAVRAEDGAERGVAAEGVHAAPLATSQIRAVSPSPAVTTSLPSGLNTAL